MYIYIYIYRYIHLCIGDALRSRVDDLRSRSGNSKVTSLQGLLQRARGDKGPNDDSTGWIGRLFNGQNSLIQTSGGDMLYISRSFMSFHAFLAAYFYVFI
jgi:hypothetical protein